MSDSFREQRPLLREDLSDEERAHIYSPLYPRRLRPADYRSRTKNKIKGAAAVISQWPGFWSTSVAHLYVVLGMIVLTTMVVYNTVVAFTLLPPSHAKRHAAVHTLVSNNSQAKIPDVNMHVFVDDIKDADLAKYLSQIELMAKHYSDFKWNLIVVLNDTSYPEAASAEKYNEVALSSLFYKDKQILVSKTKGSINVEHISLTKLMNTSPLKKKWRRIQSKFMPFLVRAVSVWEKGGIAFDPVVITQNSPHFMYIKKIENILKNYKQNEQTKDLKPLVEPKKSIGLTKYHRKHNLNNIQDIIEAMEKEDTYQSYSQENLTEAEGQNVKIIHSDTAKALPDTSITDVSSNSNTGNELSDFNNLETTNDFSPKIIPTTEETRNGYSSLTVDSENNNSVPALFLNYLSFYKPNGNFIQKKQFNKTAESSNNTNKKDVTADRNDAVSESLKKKKMYSPMIISAPEINLHEITPKNVATIKSYGTNVLTIDLKGNIIATDSACHAFIGTVFSNVHRTEAETVTNFLIEELSIFCKGVLSLCKGIDLILV